MGDIGRPVRHIEFEPLPDEAPTEPAPAPSPQPEPEPERTPA